MLAAPDNAEKTSKQSEERYRFLLENQYVLVCQWEPEGNITFANEAYCRYFGKQQAEVIGHSFHQFIHDEDKERAANHFASLHEENPGGEIEYRVVTPAGELRWLHWIDHVVYDGTGQRNKILSVGRDVTSQKNIEQELRQRIDFENLITTLSASFINIPVEEVDEQIHKTLQTIGKFLKVDRGYVFQFSENGLSMDNTHEWCAEGVEPRIDKLKGLPVSDFPWWVERLNRFETIHIPSVAELPPEAAAEKTILEAQDVLSLVVIPLIYGGSLQGFIGFDSVRDPKTWPEESLALFKIVGNMLAYAISRYRFQNELQTRERYLSILNNITVAAINPNDLATMLDLLADRMSELIHADGCYITLWDEQSSSVRMAAASQLYTQQYKDLVIESGESTMTAAVLEAGHELIAEDVFNSPYVSPRIAKLAPTRSLLGVPLIADDQKLGAVILGFNQPHSFTSSEIILCNQAASQVALAMLKVILLQKAQQRAQEAETLRLSGAAIAATLEPDEAIERILEQLERVVPFDSASVQLLGEGYLEVRAGRGWPDPEEIVGLRFPIPGDNPNTVVVTQQKPLILDDAPEAYGTFRDRPHAHIRSWLGVPLKVHDQIIGMLAVDKLQPHFYKSNHVELISAFADQVSISLENARMYADERRRIKELDALQATVAEITGELDVPNLFHAIVERAITLLGGTSGGLYLCDHEKQELRCVTSIHTSLDFTGVVLKFGEGAAGIVAQTGQPLVIGDYRVWGSRAQVYEKYQPFRSVMSAPLIWRDEVIGVIHILHDSEPNRFKPDDLTLLTLFANQAAIALHNAQLYTEAQQTSRRKALLNEIIRAAICAPDLGVMLQGLVDRLGELFDADGAYITFWDDEQEKVLPAAAYGPFSKVYPTLQFTQGEATMTSAVLKSGCVLVAEDAHHSEYISPRIAAMFPTRSMIGLPLIADGRKLGAVLIGYNQPRKFTQEDILLGEEVSAQVALVIAKMRLFEVERRRADELDALRATIADISSELKLETLLSKILERATTLLSASGGDIGLYEEDQNEIRIVVSHNMGKDYAGTRMAWGEGAMGRALVTNQPAIISGYQQWEGHSPQFSGASIQAVLAVPLQVHGRTIGALAVVDNDPKRTFTSEEQRLLLLFSHQAAIAVENAQLFDEIEQQSITDMLTGLYNRRGLFELGQRELVRTSRFGRPFSVMLADIDNFKRVNDQYSHALGDYVLAGLARQLRSELRNIDIIGRYGGEEFVILLPETDEESAYLVAERLRESVMKTTFETNSGLITITISVGVTTLREVKQGLASLIDQADTAMYQAKRRGGNKVCIFKEA